MLTQSRLKELFSYDSETGLFVRLKAPGKRSDLVGEVAGSKCGHGYLHINIDGVKYKAHRLVWLYVYGRWPIRLLDHENRVKSDNRLSNLREATKAQNEQSKPVRSTSTTGITGVYWNKGANKWQAYIKVDRRCRYLGLFEKQEDAATARRAAEIEYFKEFAPRAA
jgi:hypothetical protein